MIRAIVLLAILMMTVSAFAVAAEPGAGAIEGQVVNLSEGGSSVAEQDVTLRIYMDNAEAGSKATKTDAEGKFRFEGLSTESSYGYQVSLQFQGAEYTGELLSLGEGETTKSIEIMVYDSTTSDEAIRVMSSHTIVYVEEDSLLVREYLLLVNTGDRTYIGSKTVAADGKKETLRFALPGNTSELQFARGLMSCCVVVSEAGFVDTMPVEPGPREVAYSYRIERSSGAYTYSKVTYYPTARFDFLVQGEGVDVFCDQLTMEEPMDIEGRRFIHLAGRNLAHGSPLEIRLSGLQRVDSQGALKWAALALVLLACASGFGYVLVRKLQPVVSEGSLDRRRRRLLLHIAQLDDDLEGGKVPEELHRRARAGKKAQLLQLMRGQKRMG